jgi:hypothetical protein
MLQVFALTISAFMLSQTAPASPQRADPPQPTPTATPKDTVAGKGINEAAPQGPAPSRPKSRSASKPGVKFGQ